VIQMDKFRLFLQQIASLSDREFVEALPYFKHIVLKKGEVFIPAGQVCRRAAFILSGTLKTFYINDRGEETVSCFCFDGAMTTSYKSFVLQTASELTIQACEKCALLVIQYDDLQKLYDGSKAWQTIGRKMAEKEYLVMEQYAGTLNNETAREKYLRLLRESPQVLQKASVADVASYLGVTRRTLSRIRRELAEG
jgi:CRP-like cAMP-binding protein